MSRGPKLGSYHPNPVEPNSGSGEVWIPDTHPELVPGSRIRLNLPRALASEVEVVAANRIPGTGWWNVQFKGVE